MAAAPQYKIPPSDRDDPNARTAERPSAPGNDSAESKAVEALVRSRERTWHTFARSLLLGGLLAGLITAAVVIYIY
jgi:hypothetical protein